MIQRKLRKPTKVAFLSFWNAFTAPIDLHEFLEIRLRGTQISTGRTKFYVSLTLGSSTLAKAY